MKINI